MSKFNVGEMVVTQNATYHPEKDGSETIVLEVLGPYIMPGGTLTYLYRIDLTDEHGKKLVATEHQLRKRRPPSTDESESRQAMLDCIERAKRGCEVPA